MINKTSPTDCVKLTKNPAGDGADATIRVLVRPAAEGGFAAYGIDIDYVAVGPTMDVVTKRFANGFAQTLRAMLERGSDTSALFKSRTPADVMHEFLFSKTSLVLSCQVTPVAKDEGAQTPRELDFYSAAPLAA